MNITDLAVTIQIPLHFDLGIVCFPNQNSGFRLRIDGAVTLALDDDVARGAQFMGGGACHEDKPIGSSAPTADLTDAGRFSRLSAASEKACASLRGLLDRKRNAQQKMPG